MAGNDAKGTNGSYKAALLATVTYVGWTLKRYRRVSCKCAETSLQSSGARTRLVNGKPLPFLLPYTRFP